MTSTTTCDYTNAYIVTKQGADPAFIEPVNGNTGNNANFAFGSSTCVTVAGSDVSIVNGFTSGDLMVGLFLLFTCLMMFFGGIINHVAGIKLRDFRPRQYDIANNHR